MCEKRAARPGSPFADAIVLGCSSCYGRKHALCQDEDGGELCMEHVADHVEPMIATRMVLVKGSRTDLGGAARVAQFLTVEEALYARLLIAVQPQTSTM